MTYNVGVFVPSFPGGACNFNIVASIDSAASSILTTDATQLIHEFYAADNSVLGISTSAVYTVYLALSSDLCYSGDLVVTYTITVNNPCSSVTLSYVSLPSEFDAAFNV